QPAVDVVVHARPLVLALDAHPVAQGLGARADVRDPLDLHQAIRTGSGHAEQPAGPVVLERATCDHNARRGERGPDGVPLEPGERPPLEIERERPVAADSLAGPVWEPFSHAWVASLAGVA